MKIQRHFHKTSMKYIDSKMYRYICAYNIFVYIFTNIKGLYNTLPSRCEAVAVSMEQ